MSTRPQIHTDIHTTSSLLRPALPTPHWGNQRGSAFTIRAISTDIHATPIQVANALLQVSAYPEWNNFVPRIDITSSASQTEGIKGRLKLGDRFTEHVDMFGHGRPSGLIRMKLTLESYEEFDRGMKLISEDMAQRGQDQKDEESRTGVRLVWLARAIPDWLLRSERVHEIYTVHTNSDASRESRTTTYVCFETFSGPLAGITRLVVGKALVKRFGQWNSECKAYVERTSPTSWS